MQEAKVFTTHHHTINAALSHLDEVHPNVGLFALVTVKNSEYTFGTFIKLEKYGWLRWTDAQKEITNEAYFGN